MKQNKNNYVIKIYMIFVVINILIMSACIPVYAEKLSGDFSTPLPDYPGEIDLTAVANNGVCTSTKETSEVYTLSDTGNIYMFFAFRNSSSTSLSQYFVYTGIGSPSPVPKIYYATKTLSTGNFSGLTSYGGSWVEDQTTGYYYLHYSINLSSSSSPTQYVPTFDSFESGISYLKDYLDNPPTPEPITGEFTTALQPGYAMAIDITNLNVSLTLNQTTPISYWGLGATQFIGTVNEIPNPITENSVSSIIRWSGTGRADMYGKYYNWVSNNTISGNASNHQHVYVLIVNPLNNSSTAGSGYDVETTSNGIISVHASNSNHVKIYPMSTSFNAGNFESTTEGISATGSPDGSGGLNYTNDSTGETYVQEHGGLTTPTNTQNTINAWLENIANSIGGFFKGAIGAVTTLVNSGSAFINSLVSLYSWLPPAVYSVLSSALILVITIGVIKVFI